MKNRILLFFGFLLLLTVVFVASYVYKRSMIPNELEEFYSTNPKRKYIEQFNQRKMTQHPLPLMTNSKGMKINFIGLELNLRSWVAEVEVFRTDGKRKEFIDCFKGSIVIWKSEKIK